VSSPRLAAVLAAAVLCAAALAACQRAGGGRPSEGAGVAAHPASVLLITVDTLRPDALGWVAGRNATPVIDRLAAEGFRFPAAIAPVPLTHPSHSALMTGLWPRRLGLRDNGQVLPAGPLTLAEVLRGRGYATAAFVSGYPLDSAFGLDRGFQVYDDALTRGGGPEGDLERPAATTAASAAAWIRAAPRPWLAWVHFYDPHYPYEPPAEDRRPGPRGAYDGEVASVDRAIGALLPAIGERQAGDVLTVFAGDHGESLGEHGEGTHGFFIYDSTVVVPVFLRFPGLVPPGSSDEPARLLDVTPTILDLLGLPALQGVDGISLRPLLAGGPPASEPAYIETYQPWLSYGWSPLRAVRHRGWKLIDAPRPELYSLEDDPAERTNVIAVESRRAADLRRLLDQAVARPAAVSAPVADADALDRLRALGYTGAAAVSAEPPTAGLRDPKDGGELRDLLTAGDLALRRGELRAAVARFDAVLARDPGNRFALQRSGVAFLEQGDVRAALPRLERAVELDPRQPEARAALADALGRAGRDEAAVAQLQEAVRLQPGRAESWASLGSALGRSGKPAEAVKAMAHAVELQPRDPRLLARLAFAEHGAGRLEDAARHLREAAEASAPGAFSHSGALGLVLLQAGRRDEARVWLARSRSSEPEYEEARKALAKLEAAGR
jgi:arylsulfatase A-like enzyme/Tfp pilus assembly protein PilF